MRIFYNLHVFVLDNNKITFKISCDISSPLDEQKNSIFHTAIKIMHRRVSE